jgi:Ni/Fe-hydrogenase subunit HybB-like protein
MFMFEKAVVGSRRYWTWLGCLGAVILVGFSCYLFQLHEGLGITGMSRDVSWGLYIAQFTFFVGVAASAVMVVLPYYLHNFKAFGKITILGEFLAVSSVTMCMLFIFVDMGQPMRVLNVMLHPTLHSMMFWDMVSLSGYLVLNAVISLVMLSAEKKGVAPPHWIKPVILISIPWAVSIHTVTAFLYNGLPGRAFWLTAILAPRFLASAFAAGPALLILLAMAIRKLTRFDAGSEAIQKLALIVTYAMVINVFFVLMEVFTSLYSHIPEDAAHLKFLFVGLDGNTELVPWMWTSMALAALSLVLLIVPRYRKNERLLAFTCVVVFLTSYVPTAPEIAVVAAIWAIGFLMITVFYKITLSVRGDLAA